MADDKPPRETSRAAWYFEQYCRLGPKRSILKLAQDLERRSNNGESVVKISARRLEDYSRRFSWPARAAAFDRTQELLRREAFEAEARRREVENARLLHQTAQGCLAIGSLILASYNDDGTLAKSAGLDEAARIIKVGADIMRLASGQPTDIVGLADLRQVVQRRYEESDPETRAALVAGLKALRRLQRGDDDEG